MPQPFGWGLFLPMLWSQWPPTTASHWSCAAWTRSSARSTTCWKSYRPQRPSAIRHAGAIFQGRITSRSPHLGGAGKTVFLAFQYGVMYVLSFGIIITAFASATALAGLLATMACRSIWWMFRRRWKNCSWARQVWTSSHFPRTATCHADGWEMA